MACLSTEKILYKKDSVQKSSVQKRFAIPEIALTTTSPPSIKNMLGVIPLVSALKAQSELRHHRAFQDSKPVQVCSFIASTSINTRKRCRSQMNQRTTFRTNTLFDISLNSFSRITRSISTYCSRDNDSHLRHSCVISDILAGINVLKQ